MQRWRIWFAAGAGDGPSREVFAASNALSRREVRQTRRLVRRGGVSPDAPRARLAVAVAREAQQRKPSLGLLAAFALLPILGAWLFVKQVTQGHVDVTGVIAASVAVWGVCLLAQIWRLRTGAPRAELANLRFLDAAGQPYPADADSAPVDVSVAGRVLGASMAFVFYDLSFGALTLAGDNRPLSLDGIIARGAAFAAFMVLFNQTMMRSRRNQQAQRPTAGQHG